MNSAFDEAPIGGDEILLINPIAFSMGRQVIRVVPVIRFFGNAPVVVVIHDGPVNVLLTLIRVDTVDRNKAIYIVA